ncbi:FAD-binding oxidoreductase [Roseateles cellulosilyticus]|uniref:D-lactate dehydrogenase (cytochrome) n=1 Tax=Pelomonas cellulosilytica TaxID=2906762 RepID=A0ABS8XJ19_9BURK|nr:FAD-binding oxidoreductase [Pelomonas sp. P8]MCE4552859.1 FAD-binding oxidoreductase [Pelomonas sp. P8]
MLEIETPPVAALELLKAELVAALGAPHVSADEATCALHSQDIWGRGTYRVALVVSPSRPEQIAATLQAVRRHGYVVAPRGGGMGYTGAYLVNSPRCVSLDLSRMDRILAIEAEDMTVTVEPGCTWAALRAALAPLGLRTPFWGPMSGLRSTVGGAISQNAAMLGAGQHGISADSVVGLTVVLGDGQILRTGVGGLDGGAPFFRHYGPDLTGLFCGDSGAMGIKAAITLRLMANPAYEDYASFAFRTGRDLLSAMAAMARAGIASEMCAFDPGLTRVRMQRSSLASDVKTLGAVVGRQKSLVKGLLEAGKIALAGRDFVGEENYSLHMIAEGRSAAGVQADIAEARRIAAEYRGEEIANTIAKVIRAQPFPPLNSVLGPGGERWAPVHGVSALSVAAALFEAIERVFADMAADFQRCGVKVGYLFSSISTNALLLEPVFYWPGERLPVHVVAIQPEHLARLPSLADDPAATAVVVQARKQLMAVFQRFGCGHFQIGRTYPYRQSRDAAGWHLVEAIKATVDPDQLLNPGVLGLGDLR